MNRIICGDVLEVLKTLPSESVQCVVTSPPYWGLRDYGMVGQIGLEKSPEEYVEKMVEVFREVRRVLRKDGTLFLNLGDSYAGSGKGDNPNGKQATNGGTRFDSPTSGVVPGGLKPKDLCGIPWRVAFALQADGWWLRQDIIWAKPNPMPESVQGSHFYRHCVTIGKYEELQRVWKTKSINQDGAIHVPNLSAGKISDSEAALSKKSERNSDGESERTAARSKGKAEQILGNETSENKQGKVYGKSEGHGERAEESGELSSATSGSGGGSNGTGLDGHSGPPSLSLFLLQPEKFQNDSRPCDPIEQGREKLAREHSSSLPQVQLHKEGQNRLDSKEEIECPGCYMCENQNGFIFTLSAGRCTKSHEYIFLLTKSASYFYDAEAIKEKSVYSDPRMVDGFVPKSVNGKHNSSNRKRYKPTESGGGTSMVNHNGYFKEDGSPIGVPGTRNKRDVWTVTTSHYAEAHFATFPEEIPRLCISAGSPDGRVVLDPFSGAGTTCMVAKKLNRQYIGIELNPKYVAMSELRIETECGTLI